MKARLAEHAAHWKARAMRTTPADPAKIVPAIKALYANAGLADPVVAIVPSPLVLRVASVFAASALDGHNSRNAHAERRGGVGSGLQPGLEEPRGQATFRLTREAQDPIGLAIRQAVDTVTEGLGCMEAVSTAPNHEFFSSIDLTADDQWHAVLATRQALEMETFFKILDAIQVGMDDPSRETLEADPISFAIDSTFRERSGISASEEKDRLWVYSIALELSHGDIDCARRMCNALLNPARLPLFLQRHPMWNVPMVTACRDVLGIRSSMFEAFAPWEQAALHGGWRVLHPLFCMVCDFPTELNVDDTGRPHSSHGPSHRWRDGWRLYHRHGVPVPDHVFERPDTITVSEIENTRNAEVRRAMIERYGQTRYLLDSGAQLISQDEAGMLYRKDVAGDEPIALVRVLNSTPEPDGVLSRDEAIAAFGPAAWRLKRQPATTRWKEYVIRVPPSMDSARQAVAWTFGLSAEDYRPYAES
jgi:hypothetical protein